MRGAMMMMMTSIGIALSLTAACQAPGPGPDYEITTIAIPEGDRPAGREAFLALGCASCHKVAWDAHLPAPVSASPGPELSVRLSERTAGVVATSIIAPSHSVSAETIEIHEDDLSPMGDYTEAMTVRQLIDVVAYLRSGDSYVARTEPEPAKVR